jgi:hypothetical protein
MVTRGLLEPDIPNALQSAGLHFGGFERPEDWLINWSAKHIGLTCSPMICPAPAGPFHGAPHAYVWHGFCVLTMH